MRILDIQPIIWGYYLDQSVKLFDFRRPNIQPGREVDTCTKKQIEACLMLTNQNINHNYACLYTRIHCHVSSIFRWSYLRICGPQLSLSVSIDRRAISWSPLIVDRHPWSQSPWSSIILQIVINTGRRPPSWSSITFSDRDRPDHDHPSDRDHYRSSITLDRQPPWSSLILLITIIPACRSPFQITVTLDHQS